MTASASARLPVTVTPAASLVPDERRMDFLPTLFDLSLLMIGEHTVYHFLDRLSPDYGGGFWEFLELDGAPLYLRPASDGRFRIRCETNDYEGEVSADAAGIIATLFAFSHLSFRDRSDRMANAYARLCAFATDLADELGAIVKPQAGALTVRSRGSFTSPSGQALPASRSTTTRTSSSKSIWSPGSPTG